MQSLTKFSALFGAALMAAGCATIDVPPAPERPSAAAEQTAPPAQFFNAADAPLPLASQWWTLFGDDDLTGLIEQTLATNRRLDVAQANVNIAAAALARRTLDTSYGTRSGADIDIRRSTGRGDIDAVVGGLLGASWEYDAFGRIEASIKAAELGVEAAEQARQDIAVIVSSETALAYVDLRGAQKRLSVARENAQTQEKSLDLLKTLFENGRATELDVSRADAQYRTTLADLPRFQAIIDSALIRLAALTGSTAADFDASSLAGDTADIPALRGALALGSPAELIRRRPDIRQAETEIARLLALSDVDRARLFPVITLGANITPRLTDGNQWDQIRQFGFSLGPAISWEGPDLRRVRADIEIADAQTRRAYEVYEQTVIQALSDVEIALTNRANELARAQDLRLAAQSARTALDIATLRFEEGLDDFLDVLDAQRTLLNAQDRVEENRLQTTRLTVLTYRELGGI